MTVSVDRGFFVGLDPGQATDPTGLVIVEKFDRTTVVDERAAQLAAERALSVGRMRLVPRERRGAMTSTESHYDVRHIERLPLGMSYVDVVAYVARLMNRAPLVGTTRLACDATGIGRAVIDQMRAAGLKPTPVVITAGSAEASGPHGYKRVPKVDIVGQLDVLLHSERLRVAEELQFAGALVDELENFRVRYTARGHETFAAWRESIHDDLVLALGVAVWLGERVGTGFRSYYAPHRR